MILKTLLLPSLLPGITAGSNSRGEAKSEKSHGPPRDALPGATRIDS